MKRIFSLLLIIFLLTLTACGGDTSTTDTGGGASSTPSVESTAPESGSAGVETPELTEDHSENETPSGDTSDEGTTAPEDDIDLPKVEF